MITHFCVSWQGPQAAHTDAWMHSRRSLIRFRHPKLSRSSRALLIIEDCVWILWILANTTSNLRFEMWSLIAPLLLVSAVLPTIAEELDAKDVPAACITICTPVVMLSNACDVELDDAEEAKLEQEELAQQQRHNYLGTATTYAPPRTTAVPPHRRKRDDSAKDQAERFCMCRNTSFDVEGVTGLCASCLAQNGGPDAGEEPRLMTAIF